MIIVYGTRFFGKIQSCGRSFLATRFFHIWYVPLIPVGTQLVLEEAQDGSYRGVPASFNFKSMMAGYLRVWGPLGCLVAIISCVGAFRDFAQEDPAALVVVGVFSLVVVGALLAATVLAYAVLGKVSLEDKQKLSVYARHTGYFVDPMDMGPARQALRAPLLGTIAERARGLASMGYRMNAEPTQIWPHLALDPTHYDDLLITAAFTLARVEASLGDPATKLHMQHLQDQLWERLRQVNPPCLNAHTQFA